MQHEPQEPKVDRVPTTAIANILIGSLAWANIYYLSIGKIVLREWYHWPLIIGGVIVLLAIFFGGISQFRAWLRRESNWQAKDEVVFQAWTSGAWNVAKYLAALAFAIFLIFVSYKVFEDISKEAIIIIALLFAILLVVSNKRS